VGVALFSYCFFHYYENFHTIIPQQVYRSAELTHDEFIQVANLKQLKSVLNLRGENKPYHWYQVESNTLKSLNIPLYNIRLSSYVLPSKAVLQQLAHTLQTAPKPMLIHCASGADRTGMAAAMVVLLHNGTIAKAAKQISWEYGAIRSDSAGKQMLKAYKQWMATQHIKASTAAIFMTWLRMTNQHEPLQHHR
jgi:undecaprenyl-diphosphatase